MLKENVMAQVVGQDVPTYVLNAPKSCEETVAKFQIPEKATVDSKMVMFNSRSLADSISYVLRNLGVAHRQYESIIVLDCEDIDRTFRFDLNKDYFYLIKTRKKEGYTLRQQ